MKITIEISEQDAACLWGDHWEQPGETIESIIADHAKEEAAKFRRHFRDENIPALTEKYRQHLQTCTANSSTTPAPLPPSGAKPGSSTTP